MINYVIIVVLGVIVFFAVKNTIKRFQGDCGCGGGGSSIVMREPQDTNPKNYQFVADFTVEGMHCQNCENRIQNTINSLNGAWAKKVQQKKNSAFVLLKSEALAEDVKRAVEKTGYPVTNVKIARKE